MPDRFSPPAFATDFTGDLAQAWSDKVLEWFREAASRLPADHRFFNLLDRPDPDTASAVIPWNAFPRKFALLLPEDVERRWQLADRVVTQDLFGRAAGFFLPASGGQWRPANLPFRDQDEYCEWRPFHDPQSGRLRRIVFTCENPEYWEFVAAADAELLLRLYRTFVDPSVELQDLLFQSDVFRPERVDGGTEMQNLRGRYNPLNRWNTTDGILHLTHPANSLQAEVHLAADATVLRTGPAGLLTDDNALICCSAYGSPNRSSDPTIGGRVNELVRGGSAVTIDDPVGLYIAGIDLQPVEAPGDTGPEELWRPLRGDANKRMILRAEFAPPPGADFDLEDVLVGGEPLRFGAQIAELITMVIHGRAASGQGEAPTRGCDNKCCRLPDAPALQSHAAIAAECPPLGAVGEFEIAGAGALATFAAEADAALPAERLPDPYRRI